MLPGRGPDTGIQRNTTLSLSLSLQCIPALRPSDNANSYRQPAMHISSLIGAVYGYPLCSVCCSAIHPDPTQSCSSDSARPAGSLKFHRILSYLTCLFPAFLVERDDTAAPSRARRLVSSQHQHRPLPGNHPLLCQQPHRQVPGGTQKAVWKR